MPATTLPPPSADRLRVGLLLAGEVAAVLVLARSGSPVAAPRRHDLGAWLATATPAELATAALLPLAGALAVYLLVVTAVYVLALATGRRRLRVALAPITPAGIRRLAERAVAASLLATSLTAPAAAATPAAGGPPPGLRVPSGVRTVPAAEVPVLPTEPAGPVGTVPRPRVAAPAPRLGTATVTVRPGDHLWGIAARHLADARRLGRERVPVADIAAYWVTVVELNRSTLATGDPDLVHPGEEVRLPPIA